MILCEGEKRFKVNYSQNQDVDRSAPTRSLFRTVSVAAEPGSSLNRTGFCWDVGLFPSIPSDQSRVSWARSEPLGGSVVSDLLGVFAAAALQDLMNSCPTFFLPPQKQHELLMQQKSTFCSNRKLFFSLR